MYIQEITALKDKYARGAAKKQLAGIMEVYPRPTFKGNISRFLRVSEEVEEEPDIKNDEEVAIEALLGLGVGN